MSDDIENQPTEPTAPETPNNEEVLLNQFLEETAVTPVPMDTTEPVEFESGPAVTVKKDIVGTNPHVDMRAPIADGVKTEKRPNVDPVLLPNSTRKEREDPSIIPKRMADQYATLADINRNQIPDPSYAVPLSEINKDDVQFVNDYVDAYTHLHDRDFEEVLDKSFNRDGSDWRQGVEHPAGSGKYMTGRAANPEINANTPNKGVNAVMAAKKRMGVGSYKDAPYWHSGINLRLRAASNSELLDLDRQLVEDKTDYGFISRGAIYSSENFMMLTRVAKFVIDHVEWSQLQPTENADLSQALMNNLLITDIPALLIEQAHLMFIDGYPYVTICTKNPESCKDVRDESLLRVNRMMFVDNSRLSHAQKEYMYDRNTVRTEADMKSYQRELFGRMKGSYIELPSSDNGSNIGIRFKVPTIEEYRVESEIWFNTISDLIDTLPTKVYNAQQKDEMFKTYAGQANLRKYTSYIDSIIIDTDNKDNVVEDRETIRMILTDVLSLDSENIDRIYLGIKEFMSEATISYPVIARVPCSRCGEYSHEEDKRHPEVIPVEPAQLFFTLRDRRLVKGQILTK